MMRDRSVQRFLPRTVASGAGAICALALAALWQHPASAQMAVDKVVIEFGPEAPPRSDVEVQNTSEETLYIKVQPAEIVAPGTPDEQRVDVRDPAERGLLVSPNRLVLEPGQRQLIRFAMLSRPADRDRVYRVTITPVVGDIVAKETALKIMVGYDILAIVQPPRPAADLRALRSGRSLTVTNAGNTNALLFDGRQCDESGGSCVDLPSRRLYAGASWTVPLSYDTPAEFHVSAAGQTTNERF
jgi:Mat/Ecp fimbriae periplasmic chaperone